MKRKKYTNPSWFRIIQTTMFAILTLVVIAAILGKLYIYIKYFSEQH